MGSEVLLYGYGFICLSMIVFNLVYGLVMRGSDARRTQRSRQFEELVNGQLYRISQGQPLDNRHIGLLRRSLRRVNNLRAFDQTLDQYLADGGGETVRAYLAQIQPVILHLTMVYRKRENLQAAYFAWFLNRHRLNKYMQMDTVQDVLVDYMEKDSLYCRVNALKALCAFGSPDRILQAVTIQDHSASFLHEKILTECLLVYEGDSDQLIHMFWEQLDRFSVRTQRAILDYIRFKTGDYQEEMFAVMTDSRRDRELRYSAIRYFGRYPYPPARAPLLEFLGGGDPDRWEYAAISAMALAAYPGQDVVNALMEAMHSGNWYVRYNAAVSLEAHGLSYSDLIELVGGRNRYAREMVMYLLESRRLEQAARTAQAAEEAEEMAESEEKEAAWA